MAKADLIAFEKEVEEAFKAKRIRGPVHLSGGNEAQLVEVFKSINQHQDWIFTSYRNHYHALLHGIPPEWLMEKIIDGRSMNIMSAEHRFYSSAIVGGQIPPAVGVAAALAMDGSDAKVWCFLGDMAATTGIYHEAYEYAAMNDLPIRFVVEDNHLSCDTPTHEAWGGPGPTGEGVFNKTGKHILYTYERTYPHAGVGYFVF